MCDQTQPINSGNNFKAEALQFEDIVNFGHKIVLSNHLFANYNPKDNSNDSYR